jgi:serine protease DegQ
MKSPVYAKVAKIWLLFAQVVTVLLAFVLVLRALPQVGVPRSFLPAFILGSHSSYAYAAQQASPAVVSIAASRKLKSADDSANPARHEAIQEAEEEPVEETNKEDDAGKGSGVIVDNRGYILTNHHVIDQAEVITVKLEDNRVATAQVIGSDPDTDLAVLKISLPDLPTLTFARRKSIRVGDTVLAIGNPYNIGQTVTMGVISALGRDHLGINTFENFIQTDAAINPGNSGGALVNMDGELIGINTAILSNTGSSQGIAFTIPTSVAQQVLQSIIEHGYVVRGAVELETAPEMTEDIAQSIKLPKLHGSFVTAVKQNTPAAKAGLRKGDVILSVNKQVIHHSAHFVTYVAALKPGEIAQLEVWRDGKSMAVAVEVVERARKKTDKVIMP